MIYVVLHAENSDVVATYPSLAQAEHDLAAYVARHPGIEHKIGIRPYDSGRPVGDFEPAFPTSQHPR